jgi:hypothetical protein
MLENPPACDGNFDPLSFILIWETGAFFGLTPFCSDFIDYVECDIPVWDVTKVNKVIRIETKLHKFTGRPGIPVFLLCISYHLQQTDVCHISPQTYHQLHSGYSVVYGQSIQIKLCTSTIIIDIVWDLTNLPVVHESQMPEKANHGLGLLMRPGLYQTHSSSLDFFGDIDKVVSSIVTQSEQSNFLSLVPVCWQLREQELDNPSEGATFVALETWYQYVPGTGTHAQDNI